MSCAFCNNPDLEARIIIKNELAFAFPTNMPIVRGHVLISPIRHVQYYEDLSPDEKAAIEELRLKLKTALQKIFGAEGFNYAWNENKVGGQSVPHFHLHMLPRKEGDAGVHQYEPREFIYRFERQSPCFSGRRAAASGSANSTSNLIAMPSYLSGIIVAFVEPIVHAWANIIDSNFSNAAFPKLSILLFFGTFTNLVMLPLLSC